MPGDEELDQAAAGGDPASIFLSYSHLDHKAALPVLRALEAAGYSVWWDRKIGGGERYLKTTEAALEGAAAVVVLWSSNSVVSHWVQDEAMRGRDRNCLVPLTLDGTEPPLGFRQFQVIDFARRGRKARDEALDAMLSAVAALVDRPPAAGRTPPPAPTRRRWPGLLQIGFALLLLAVLGGWWWMSRPAPGSTLSLRLGGFESMGAGVPAGAAGIMNAEFGTAFADDPGLVVVSRDGDLVLRGTIRRAGEMLRYTTRLEAADGALLWSESTDQAVSDPLAPRQVAIRSIYRLGCGISAALSYGRRLPSRTLSLYLSYCQLSQSTAPGRALDVARRIVAETPDFSMGWSALANSAIDLIDPDDPATASALRREAEAAVERALRLDPRNGQAWSVRAFLTPATRPLVREAMMRRSVEARPSDCGCEHQYYGQFLTAVGRARDALPILQRAVDMLPQAPTTNFRLAIAYYQIGQSRRGDEIVRSLAPIWRGIPFLARIEAVAAVLAGRWADAARLFEADSPDKTAALRRAFAALASRDPARIAAAAAAVESLARGPGNDPFVAQTLAALGRGQAALASADRLIGPGEADGAQFLFSPPMRSTWREPAFERLLRKAGLLDYWRASRTRPDLCSEAGAPPFCRSLR